MDALPALLHHTCGGKRQHYTPQCRAFRQASGFRWSRSLPLFWRRCRSLPLFWRWCRSLPRAGVVSKSSTVGVVSKSSTGSGDVEVFHGLESTGSSTSHCRRSKGRKRAINLNIAITTSSKQRSIVDKVLDFLRATGLSESLVPPTHPTVLDLVPPTHPTVLDLVPPTHPMVLGLVPPIHPMVLGLG